MEKELLKKILFELVQIPSMSGTEQKVAEYIKEKFGALGLKTRIDEVGNVILEQDGVCDSEVFYYISHIDTVKPYIKPKILDDFVYGRGAVDAKGPLLAMIDALYESRNPCIKVYGLVGEESDSRGARYLLENTKKLSNVVIGEPSNNQICIGYRGRILLRIDCKGQNQHAATSSQVNPIQYLTNIILLMEKIADTLGQDKVLVTPTKIVSRSMSNVVPSKGQLLYDIRFSEEKIANELLDKLKSMIPTNCSIQKISYLPPVEVKPSDILVQSLARSIIKEGLKVNYIKKMGTSDMNVLYPITEHIVSFGPGDSKLSHTPKEKINIKDIMVASSILRSLPAEYSRIKSRA
jgi:LysW-gamma-L-lysine carboxypeptidase